MSHFRGKALVAIIVVFLSLSFTRILRASSCCVRSAAMPTLLLSEDRAQLNTSFGGSSYIGQITDKEFISGDRFSLKKGAALFQISGSYAFLDRFQFSAQVPAQFIQSRTGELVREIFQVSEFRSQIGYEFLPEWVKPEWGTQGFAFFGISLPFAPPTSCCDISSRRGYVTPSLATIVVKRSADWDGFALLSFHYSFPGKIEKASGDERLMPGFGTTLALGIGYSFAKLPLRFGLRLQPRLDEPGRRYLISNNQFLSYSNQNDRLVFATDFGIDLSWMIAPQMTLLLSYNDSSLIPGASNTDLYRSLLLNFQYRFPR